MPLPCFFPSISSIKTNLRPLDYLEVLAAVGHPLLLISAYDIVHSTRREQEALSRLLGHMAAEGTAILLDSGNYESYWKADQHWNPTAFASVLARNLHHLAFCFDDHSPPSAVEQLVETVEASVERDQAHSSEVTVVPIVHGSAEQLPRAVRGVAERLHPVLVAVAERELGDGMLARVRTVARIRRALDDTGATYPLHLLGTGNPLSILAYAAAGADSFDGLEWCQTTVDPNSGLLYHFHQGEMFDHRGPVAVSDVPYTLATLAHNLLFYRAFMSEIQEVVRAADLGELLLKYLPDGFLPKLRSAIEQARSQ